MELTAVIEGLAALRESCAVTVVSDSRYVVDGIEKGWAKSWKRNGWRKSDKKPALNADLWDKLLTPVSYTHLDGYKRQPVPGRPGPCP